MLHKLTDFVNVTIRDVREFEPTRNLTAIEMREHFFDPRFKFHRRPQGSAQADAPEPLNMAAVLAELFEGLRDEPAMRAKAEEIPEKIEIRDCEYRAAFACPTCGCHPSAAQGNGPDHDRP